MKHYFAIILLLLINDIFAQKYHPLLAVGKSWDIFNSSYNGEIGIVPYESGIRYTINGDTTIENREYATFHGQQILKDNDEPVYVGPFRLGERFKVDNIFMREDTLTKRVWVRYFNEETDEEQEILAYDFSIEVGDTLKSWAAQLESNFGEAVIACSAINSVTLENGEIVKSIELTHDLEPYVSEFILESVGGVSLFFPWDGFSFVTECVFELSQPIIGSRSSYCANMVSNINRNIQRNEVSIFPNPFTDDCYLKLPNNLSSYDTVHIFDIHGQLIFQQKIEYSTERLDIANLAKGMYQVQIMENGRLQNVGRIIKL